MKRLLLWVVTGLAVGLLAGLSMPTYAATNDHNPAGNNGFIKVNNEPLPDNIPQNHPHVSCTFDIEFYNYDKNNKNADVQFALQAPTNKDANKLSVASGNLKPFIGSDTAGGGKDLDARETYKLQFSGPAHEHQGYHVKLTVSAPGSKGSDQKHKVFWVQPCADSTTQTNSSGPQVLDSQTPDEMPATGASLPLGLSILVAIAAYAIAYWRQQRLAGNK